MMFLNRQTSPSIEPHPEITGKVEYTFVSESNVIEHFTEKNALQ